MPIDSTPIDGTSAPDPTRVTGRSAVGRLDGRTKLARRAKQLARAFVTELGDTLSDAQLVAVKRAGEMTAIAEETRARWLAGDWKTTGTDVVRIDGAARRAILDLGLPTSNVRPAETLEQYLARTSDDTEDDQDGTDDELEGDDLATGEETP